MGKNVGKSLGDIRLNLGCGFDYKYGYVNVDKHDNCKPDVVHDLNAFPYPWDDNSVDGIEMFHVLEHLTDWWGALEECARILKPGAAIEIRVPDTSHDDALCCRDHYHIFSANSFSGLCGAVPRATNAESMLPDNTIPLRMVAIYRVPFRRHWWMTHWPFRGLLAFCTHHLRNFIVEQQFVFVKVGDDGEVET